MDKSEIDIPLDVVESGLAARDCAPADGLADLLIDSLDIGIALVDPRARLLRCNVIARHLMAAFGGFADRVPHRLWQQLGPTIEAASATAGQFTPASQITAPDQRRLFVRCRAVRGPAIVITIAPAVLRKIDVHRVLADQFGLSAQEIRIAFLAVQGYRNREIAERLSIVEGTVKNYLTAVFSALSVRSRTELASELAQLVEEQTDVHHRVR